jgi:hypothetical protein
VVSVESGDLSRNCDRLLFAVIPRWLLFLMFWLWVHVHISVTLVGIGSGALGKLSSKLFHFDNVLFGDERGNFGGVDEVGFVLC